MSETIVNGPGVAPLQVGDLRVVEGHVEVYSSREQWMEVDAPVTVSHKDLHTLLYYVQTQGLVLPDKITMIIERLSRAGSANPKRTWVTTPHWCTL